MVRSLFGWIGLGLLFTATVVSSQENPVLDHFQTGNSLYENGEYAQALDEYNQVASDGVESAALFLNMGNTYFRLGKLGWAIVYYERARRLAPGDKQILHSLQIAQGRTQNEIPSLPYPAWLRVWRTVVTTFGPDGLFLTGFILYLIALALVAHWIWMRGETPWRRRLLMVVSPMAFALLIAAYLASGDLTTRDAVVVIQAETNVFVDPDAPDTAFETIYEGLVLDVMDRGEDWIHVRLPNGETGWIQIGTVEKI